MKQGKGRVFGSLIYREAEYMACRENPVARAEFIAKHGAKKLLALPRESLRSR